MAVRLIATLLILSVVLTIVSGSSIPIWEFLSRSEKMSYLYSTFAHLVSDHCKMNPDTRAVPVNHCKRDLLSYGYEKLQAFSDLELDKLDPYQRNANQLIWRTIMNGHPAATTTPTRSQQSPSHLHYSSTSPTATNRASYPNNPLFEEADRKHSYAMDMDVAYGYTLPPTSEFYIPTSSSKYPSYLNGPYVIRVRPDGTPIEEDINKPYPRDDDLETYQLSKQKKSSAFSSFKQKRLTNVNIQQVPDQQPPVQFRQRRQSKVINKPYAVHGIPYQNIRLVEV